MKNTITQKDLESFGKVEHFGESDGKFMVVITDGYVPDPRTVPDFCKRIQDSFSDKFPNTDHCITIEGRFELVLSKPTKS